MCELFGVSSKKKMQLNTLLQEFFSHSREHPHGWGMAFFYGNAVSLEKQPTAAYDSRYLRERLRAKIETDKMIAHIRLATKGNMEYENSHPFVMRDNYDRTWTLAHNGTVFECDVLDSYFYVQEGQTDSERILYYIIDRVNQEQDKLERALNAEERFKLIDDIVCTISPENKLNLLVYDGEIMYVHTNYKDSLHISERDGACIFSTRPLDLKQWSSLPMNTLLGYREGEQEFIGTNHGHEFFDDEEKIRMLFWDYSAL